MSSLTSSKWDTRANWLAHFADEPPLSPNDNSRGRDPFMGASKTRIAEFLVPWKKFRRYSTPLPIEQGLYKGQAARFLCDDYYETIFGALHLWPDKRFTKDQSRGD